LPIIARAHSDEEVAHLKHHGATSVIMGEQEIAKAMLAQIAGGVVTAFPPKPVEGGTPSAA
jgi:Trk K+ transport system NAD-binding subunit